MSESATKKIRFDRRSLLKDDDDKISGTMSGFLRNEKTAMYCFKISKMDGEV